MLSFKNGIINQDKYDNHWLIKWIYMKISELQNLIGIIGPNRV